MDINQKQDEPIDNTDVNADDQAANTDDDDRLTADDLTIPDITTNDISGSQSTEPDDTSDDDGTHKDDTSNQSAVNHPPSQPNPEIIAYQQQLAEQQRINAMLIQKVLQKDPTILQDALQTHQQPPQPQMYPYTVPPMATVNPMAYPNTVQYPGQIQQQDQFTQDNMQDLIQKTVEERLQQRDAEQERIKKEYEARNRVTKYVQDAQSVKEDVLKEVANFTRTEAEKVLQRAGELYEETVGFRSPYYSKYGEQIPIDEWSITPVGEKFMRFLRLAKLEIDANNKAPDNKDDVDDNTSSTTTDSNAQGYDIGAKNPYSRFLK